MCFDLQATGFETPFSRLHRLLNSEGSHWGFAELFARRNYGFSCWLAGRFGDSRLKSLISDLGSSGLAQRGLKAQDAILELAKSVPNSNQAQRND